MYGNDNLYILRSGCSVAEFKGTYGSNESVMIRYANACRGIGANGKEFKVNKELGRSAAHRFVIMSGQAGDLENFPQFVARNKLGKVLKSPVLKNNNHGGWGETRPYDNNVFAMLFIPNHDGIVSWMQRKHDKDFSLV